MDEPKIVVSVFPDRVLLCYLVATICFGALSGLASLLGSDKVINPRVIAAYVVSGAICSFGVVLLLGERYGFSYFLVGISIFTGYKAFDVLAMVSMAVSSLVCKLIEITGGKKEG